MWASTAVLFAISVNGERDAQQN